MMSRDSGFYKTPVVKSLLVLTSASSILHGLSLLRNSYPSTLLLVRVWCLPSVGLWLAAALILYQHRVLERRRGSSSFMSYLTVSGAVSMIIYTFLMKLADNAELGIGVIPGTFIYSLVGILSAEYVSTVMPRQSRLAGLPFSSNLALYAITSLFSATSISSIALTASGLLGGFIVRSVGVSLPHAPLWLGSALGKVLGGDPPPRVYSGASLSVQAQQRTDEIEQLMASMYTRQQQARSRRVVISRPVRQEVPPPPQQQVEQLQSMGFSQQECVQALQHAGNNMEAAIQLLTARRT